MLAEAIVEIAELKPLGVLHVAGPRLSRYEFAVMIAERFGLLKENISEANMNEFRWKARRPRDSSLDSSRGSRLLKTKFNDISLALDQFYQDYTNTGERS